MPHATGRSSALFSLLLLVLAAASPPAFAHADKPHASPAAAAHASSNKVDLVGRVNSLIVVDHTTGVTRGYPFLETADGQRFRLENAGSPPVGAWIGVSGRLDHHTLHAASVRAAASPPAARQAPDRVQLLGTLRVFHIDYPDGTAEFGYSLFAVNGRRNVIDFGTPPPGVENGARVAVSGPVDASGFVDVDTLEILGAPAAAPQPKATAALGTMNYTVIPLKYPSNTTTPYTYNADPGGWPIATITSTIFGAAPAASVAEYYKEVSFGGQLVGGVVANSANTWLKANSARPTACSSSAELNAVLDSIETNGNAAALAAGFNVNNLPGAHYVIDALPCGWLGLGYIGFPLAYSKGTASLLVVGHEWGHNFGLYHAGSVDCGANVIASSGCGVSEYGDPFVIMGNQRAGHLNAHQKNVLGYIPGGVVTHNSGTTTYTLGPIELAGQSQYAVRIPTGSTSRTYWIEFRQPIGFDAPVPGTNALGAQIRLSRPFENNCGGCTGNYDDTQILDMTPGTATFTDAALLANQSYTDSTHGVTINVLAASASSLSVQVIKGAAGTPTTTTLASSLNPSTFGQGVTFTATVTGTNPTGTVAFRDGATTIASCAAVALTGSGNSRTAACATSALTAGVHSMTAAYGGDAGNASSTSSALSQTVRAMSTTTLASSLNPSVSGNNVTFTATVTGTAPTGSVGFTSDGGAIAGCTAVALTGSGNTRTAACATAALTVGTHAIVASYAGDAGNVTSSSTALSQVVNTAAPAPTTTTLASSLNPSIVGTSVTFTATVTGSAPTGTVAFAANGSGISGCSAVALTGSGNSRTAACATSALAAGTHSIVATYGGNAGNAGSTSSALSQVVNTPAPVPTSTTLASSLNPSIVGTTVTFTATVTGSAPTGTVAFTANGLGISGCSAVGLTGSGNSRTAACATSALAAGTHSIVATYGGNAGNAGSTSSALSQVVNTSALSPTKTTLTSASNTSTAGPAVALIATVTATPPVAGGSVSFTANGVPVAGCTSLPIVAQGASRRATCNAVLPVGAFSVVARYGGDASSLPSTSLVFSQVIPAAAIGNTLQFASPIYAVNEHGSGNVTLTVTRMGDVSNAAGVSYSTASGSATSGADFATTSGALQWPAHDASPRNIVVSIANDGLVEGSESFTVSLSLPQGATLGVVSSAAVTIVDDEAAVASALGAATVAQHPYGTSSVQGATQNGNAITSFQPNAVIQLGAAAGAPGSFARIDFQALDVAQGQSLTIRSGAAGQTVVLANVGGTVVNVGGVLRVEGANGAPPPKLVLQSRGGVNVSRSGEIIGPAGVTLDTMDAAGAVTGAPLVNEGRIDGGPTLMLTAARVNGGGAFRANALTIATPGNLNNPVNGAHYLSNGLQLYPSSGGDMTVTLAGFGIAPQFMNLMVHGNARLSMPSAWPNGTTLPPNNRPVMPGETRPPGTPDPSYGGGSMIVQAKGSFTLDGGASQDFVFPGGLAFLASGMFDVNGVGIDNGWTQSGTPLQGVFIEAASIVDNSAGGLLVVRTNNFNWVNFSVRPALPVKTFQLQEQPAGAQFLASDALSPHLNFYSITVEAAAAGQCWTCLMNPQVIDFSVVP